MALQRRSVGWTGLVFLVGAGTVPAAGPAVTESRGPAPEVVVRWGGRVGPWAVAETANFRIYHDQPVRFVEAVARVAERTRAAMQRCWFGGEGRDWDPPCEVYLHTTAEDFWRETGVPSAARGYSRFRRDGRGLCRTIELCAAEPDLLPAVVPHEVTHTVLAGQFGDRPLPRWADEGMAILAEPAAVRARHARRLARAGGEQFRLGDLLRMDYPDARFVDVFYAESVSLVDFLVRQRGPREFTRFLREGLEDGYGRALVHHYGFRDLADLDARWSRAARGTPELPAIPADVLRPAGLRAGAGPP